MLELILVMTIYGGWQAEVPPLHKQQRKPSEMLWAGRHDARYDKLGLPQLEIRYLV